MVLHGGRWEFANSFDELSMILFHSFKKLNFTSTKVRRIASDSVGKPVYTSDRVGFFCRFFSCFFVFFRYFVIFLVGFWFFSFQCFVFAVLVSRTSGF